MISAHRPRPQNCGGRVECLARILDFKKIHTALKWENTEGRDGMEDTGMSRSIILN